MTLGLVAFTSKERKTDLGEALVFVENTFFFSEVNTRKMFLINKTYGERHKMVYVKWSLREKVFRVPCVYQ